MTPDTPTMQPADNTAPSIIPPEELRAARTEALTEIETIIRTLARRAERPAKRQVFAELEATAEGLRRQWAAQGLVA